MKLPKLKEARRPIAEEPIQKETGCLSRNKRKTIVPDTADGKEEEATELPQELIQDFQGNYTDEQRQNLDQKILRMDILERFRGAVFANREARNLLIRDPNKMIAMNVLRNIKIIEGEVLRVCPKKRSLSGLPLAIAQDQKWKNSYPIRSAIVGTPNTPLSLAINFLPHLYEKDLNSLIRKKMYPYFEAEGPGNSPQKKK